MNSAKRIIITHCVDPHHFYFKYVDECVNNDYSNFDYVLQCYGNGLHGRQLRTHDPNENELIIFFDVISNKWLRGRVSNMNDAEVTLWCIDNGIVRTTEKHFIQPLSDNLKKDFNLVQLGGLSVLPAESTLNFDTLNVKMQVTHSWDNEMSNNFKMIIGSAKRLNFIEEMQLGEHHFGTLFSESWKDKVVVINDILLQMCKAVSCGGSAGMASYVSEKRLKEELYQSLEKATTFSKSIKSKGANSISSKKCEFEMHTNPFKSGTSSDGIELHLEPVKTKETLKPSGHSKMEMQATDAIELHLEAAKSKETSKPSGHSKMETQTTDAIELHLEAAKSKETSKPSGHSKMETQTTDAIELHLEAAKSKETSKPSGHSKMETQTTDAIELHLEAANSKETSKPSGHSKMETQTTDAIELHLEAAKSKETSKTSGHSKMKMQVNPFKPKRTSGAPGKSDGIEWKEPKGTLRPSVKSETDMHSKAKLTHDSEKAERPSIQNDGASNPNMDKTGVSSVQTSQENETDLLSPNESFDTLENSASMAVSTFCTTESEHKAHRNISKTKPHHIEYECHLKTLKFRTGDTLRQPLQTSMGWINQQQQQLLSVATSVADHNESCSSSIVDLQESDRNTLFVE